MATSNSSVGGGVSFGLCEKFNTGIEPGYNRFHSILTSGFEAKGTVVYDTLSLSDFFISFEGSGIDEGTTLEDAKGQEWLAKFNSFQFGLANETWAADQSMDIEVHEILLIGEDGLKADMKITK